MSAPASHMLLETGEAADAVERLLSREVSTVADLARRIGKRRPTVVTTAARGSSDHAATYFKYLYEICCGTPVASIGPSVASVYQAPLHLENGVHLTVSQSGASPDIVALQAAAKTAGALTVAFVNATGSPLAREADVVVPLHAGPEKSVAATKSFIASCAALAALTAEVAGDADMAVGLRALPRRLATSPADWRGMEEVLRGTTSFYTAGRGPGYAIALEAALKAKETAALHAEAFSLAEMMHGPMRLAGTDFPILAFVPDDRALPHSDAAIRRLSETGVPVLSISTTPLPGLNVRVPSTGNGLIDPIAFVTDYYRLIELVTRKRGFDPDAPGSLKKVTQTI